ncbi:fungal Zn binuclear cluster domain-containing protein [Penicillium canariense]|uniref:Fungal Zn binuclear cluster domain-containing protein n=1 Tax=Penicillium canariense TaxID=189055 RepID=A0A9W9LJX0_9EURO|nr:fungal Zn binuclear cluster domain-containing protein [Penicillium canariense]KAJ5159721.1 fungal Zn binuclear cluster domain-containing protein [Penicillium canariense]
MYLWNPSLALTEKVKCRDPDNEGCARCIRLGKSCTFSTVKHRGDHIQTASINKDTPHQHSLDWLNSLPPSALSSCRDEHEEPEDNPASSLPDLGDGHGHGNVNDIPPTFDLSFLANFDHEPSDPGGEDSSSFALFSAILPSSTHPEPEPISLTRMSGTFLAPPLSSEDESQRYLPPIGHTHPQDPSLFDICIATPAFLHTSTSTSTSFPSRPTGQPCGCLAAVVFAVEQFEASCHGHRAELDSIVAYQKEAIERCRAQLECSSCITRRETLVLVVFLLEKIVAACGRIVGLYRLKDVQLHLPSSSRFNGDRSLDIGLATAKADWRELLLGDYEISSPLEWEHLVHVLIFLQLRAARELLMDVKSMESEVLGETLMASLAQAQIRLGELEKDMVTP